MTRPSDPRLLWLSHFVPWPSTGHGALARSYHLVRETARRRELHLVALAPPPAGGVHDDGALRDAHAGLSAYCASVTLVPIRTNVGRMRRALLAARSFAPGSSHWERWYWSQQGAMAVRDTVARVAPSLVHLDTVFLRPYAHALTTPIVLNHHNVESHLLVRRAETGSPPARAFFAAQARRVLDAERALSARARMNVMVSDVDADRLREVVPTARTTVVANGVDLEFFQIAPVGEADPRALVFLGGMDWFPNRDAIDWFVTDIWPALASDGVATRATIVGRHPSPVLLEGAARDARLVAAGFVDDVRPYVASAAIFICPMRVGGGTRLKILDALAMGRVLVSTQMGVEGIPVVDGEHYLRAETPADFVAQVRRAAGDGALRDRLAAAGRALVEQAFGWHGLGDRLHRAYDEALQG